MAPRAIIASTPSAHGGSIVYSGSPGAGGRSITRGIRVDARVVEDRPWRRDVAAADDGLRSRTRDPPLHRPRGDVARSRSPNAGRIASGRATEVPWGLVGDVDALAWYSSATGGTGGTRRGGRGVASSTTRGFRPAASSPPIRSRRIFASLIVSKRAAVLDRVGAPAESVPHVVSSAALRGADGDRACRHHSAGWGVRLLAWELVLLCLGRDVCASPARLHCRPSYRIMPPEPRPSRTSAPESTRGRQCAGRTPSATPRFARPGLGA